MEINNVQPTAVETLARPEAVKRETETRPESTEQTANRPATEAAQVEISAEARARQDADMAALKKMEQAQSLAATYNASGEIGG